MSNVFGKYTPYNTIIHRLDPRIKFFALIALMVMCFLPYGNYANNIEGTKSKAVTGRNSKWVTNNIYDLAGNVWEISTEEWGDIYEKNHSGRGGGFHNDGINYPISCRVAEYDGAYTYIGFRLVLYLK